MFQSLRGINKRFNYPLDWNLGKYRKFQSLRGINKRFNTLLFEPKMSSKGFNP